VLLKVTPFFNECHPVVLTVKTGVNFMIEFDMIETCDKLRMKHNPGIYMQKI